jgi:hypothetical protein
MIALLLNDFKGTAWITRWIEQFLIYLSYIYLGYSVCHIPVIFLSVVVAER